MPKVAIIMGSDSDFPVLKSAIKRLKAFGIDTQVRVMSAHRTPDEAAAFAKNAESDGIEVIIAAAGMAAHLAGVLAANTPLPVIGIPMKSSQLDGMDALLSTVMMPPGVPVATVGINGADNAALLALQMLSIKYADIRTAVKEQKLEMAKKVCEKDATIQAELADI